MNSFTGIFQGPYLYFRNSILNLLAQATPGQILKGLACPQHLWETMMLMVLMPTPSVIMHLICDNNQNWFLNLNLSGKTLCTTEGSGFFISVLQKLDLFQLKSSNPGAIDEKINGSALQEKSSFKMLGLHFSSELNWGSYSAKTNPRKQEP